MQGFLGKPLLYVNGASEPLARESPFDSLTCDSKQRQGPQELVPLGIHYGRFCRCYMKCKNVFDIAIGMNIYFRWQDESLLG